MNDRREALFQQLLSSSARLETEEESRELEKKKKKKLQRKRDVRTTRVTKLVLDFTQNRSNGGGGAKAAGVQPNLTGKEMCVSLRRDQTWKHLLSPKTDDRQTTMLWSSFPLTYLGRKQKSSQKSP